jgi:hypothetical protein
VTVAGYGSEYAAALALRKSEWVPSPAPSFSALRQEPRLPLFEVLNFLAFDVTEPPAEICRLMHIAHRERAFRALCAAAKADKVVIFGTPRGGGARQRIAPIEFDINLALADQDGAIGFDLEAVTMDRFDELRRSPNRLLWRDVYVDRVTLVSWMKSLPARTRTRAKARGIADCTKWLVGERESGPQQHRKEDYRAKGAKDFGVGPQQFKIAWNAAREKVPRDDWGKPGAPRKIIGRK